MLCFFLLSLLLLENGGMKSVRLLNGAELSEWKKGFARLLNDWLDVTR